MTNTDNNNISLVELISFFSQHSFFKLRSDEKQVERFNYLKDEFFQYFDTEATEEHAQILFDYQDRQRDIKAKRERARLEKEHNKPLHGGIQSLDETIINLEPGKYVLTSAQNNTLVDPTFFKSLVRYCKVNEARLLIARVTYNKTGFINDDDNELWYDPAVLPYLIEGHISLSDRIHFICDANVLPTAKNPLTGFSGITKPGVSAVIPTMKIALKCEAALKGVKSKVLLGTGTVTQRNYIHRRAGSVAAIEHSIGALFIDSSKELPEMRHLEQMEGYKYFYDEHAKYMPTCTKPATGHISGFQPGDIHAEKMSKTALSELIGFIEKYEPNNLFIHDLMDFSSRNHHNVKDCAFIHKTMLKGATVEKDINKTVQVLDALIDALPKLSIAHIIESNHDLAINTWLKNTDFKQDPINAKVYLKCMLALYEHQEVSDDDFNMLEYVYHAIGSGSFSSNGFCPDLKNNHLIFHKTDESVMLSGVEMGNHGHNGVNGARGNPVSFRALGTPMNTGHTHSPAINGRVYTSGCNELEMGYNLGASSWRVGHILTFANGQRQIIFG